MSGRGDPPRRLVAELETEAMLGRYRILVVEGPSDLAFLQQWLDALDLSIVVVTIDEIDLSEFGAQAASNREQLIGAAHSFPDAVNVRFLADRDLQVEPLTNSPPTLLLTDFPALESYTLTDSTLKALLFHAKRLPPLDPDLVRRRRQVADSLDKLVEALANFLVPLFYLRRVHTSERSPIEFPKDLRKFRKAGPPVELNVTKLISHLQLTVHQSEVPASSEARSCSDLRPHAYGHDVARAVWANWTDLRQRTGIVGSEELERLMLSLVHAEELAQFDLFENLTNWVS